MYCQIRERLEAVLPGYAACFPDLWANEAHLEIARRYASPAAIREAGVTGLARILKGGMTPTPDPMSTIQHRLSLDLATDQAAKTMRIQALERELARLLVQTPYVLLISHAGINLVSAAELASEMGRSATMPATVRSPAAQDSFLTLSERCRRSTQRRVDPLCQPVLARHLDADRQQSHRVQPALQRLGRRFGRNTDMDRSGAGSPSLRGFRGSHFRSWRADRCSAFRVVASGTIYSTSYLSSYSTSYLSSTNSMARLRSKS